MTTSAAGHFHTTIKVTSDLRDRLKAQARSNQRTLGEHLECLADLEDRRVRMDLLAAQVAATSPDEMASYREELRYWDAVSGD